MKDRSDDPSHYSGRSGLHLGEVILTRQFQMTPRVAVWLSNTGKHYFGSVWNLVQSNVVKEINPVHHS